jgi:hypothetical protein
MGHLTRLKSKNPDDYSLQNCADWNKEFRSNSIRNLSDKFIYEKYGVGCTDIATVNNRPFLNDYIEDNPKDRVIHLLKDMVEAGL